MGSYTDSGNLLSVTDSGSRTTTFTYDMMGRRLTVDAPNTTFDIYAYDITGRLGSVTSPAGTFTYGYLANSMRLLHMVTGPAHIVTNTWDSTRDVLTEKENKVGTSIISAYDYSVNPLGQRTEVAKTGSAFASNRSIGWGYDALGQVTKADSSITGFDRAYEYDGIGNRKEAADSLTLTGTPNYAANALNQYTAVGTLVPVYDLDGNAEAYPVPAHLSANSVLGWDAENRLKSATVNSVTTAYLYDSGSRRIAQTTGSTTTVYVYDAWNPVVEFSTLDFETFDLQRSYTWGLDLSGSLQGAGGVGGLLLITDHSALGTPSYFPTFDGNGNVSEYLEGTGAISAHYEYDPFGRATVASGTKAGDFAHRFSTKPVDSATGFLYHGYRWFDPVTGKWPSRDPIGESVGANLYGFIGNDGLTRVDNLGLQGVPTKEEGLASLETGRKTLKDVCDQCCEVKDVQKCKDEVDGIIDTTKSLWDANFGKGPEKGLHTVGGYYCYNWALGFLKGDGKLPGLDALKLKVWAVKSDSAWGPEWEIDRVKTKVVHVFVRVNIKNVKSGAKDCSAAIDDGLLDKILIHRDDKWPDNKKGWGIPPSGGPSVPKPPLKF